MVNSKNQHVVPHSSGKWAVTRPNTERASKTFETQKEAISYAKTNAIKSKSELIIHNKEGRIREKNSYGNDNYPPKG